MGRKPKRQRRRPYKCPICGDSFTKPRGLTIHWKVHTPEEEKAAKGLLPEGAAAAPSAEEKLRRVGT
jgi:ribosomal protein L37AE/L43A